MKDIETILRDYTSGETTLEETNAALADAGMGVKLDPERNTLTASWIPVPAPWIRSGLRAGSSSTASVPCPAASTGRVNAMTSPAATP